MEVFVVMEYAHEDTQNHGVFFSEAKAEAWIQAYTEAQNSRGIRCSDVNFTIDWFLVQ